MGKQDKRARRKHVPPLPSLLGRKDVTVEHPRAGGGGQQGGATAYTARPRRRSLRHQISSVFTERYRRHQPEATTSRKHRGGKGRTDGRATTPVTPAAAMRLWANELTSYEQSEILEHSEIYFVGNTPDKIRAIPQTSQNSGYDDESGDYTIVMHDHIAYRYEVLSLVGKGSFGQVVRVYDHKYGSFRALKLIRNKKRFHQQGLIEIKILEYCNQMDKDGTSHIVKLEGFVQFRNHLCLVFELLHTNLYEFIKSTNFRGVSLGLIRRFATQILGGMVFIRNHGIIHCDLKPENIMLRSKDKSALRLIDFGSACFEDERVYTYIQSRFYRSPEVILGIPYDVGIDMWSCACILAELYAGYPLFPGENETEQIQCIMEILGVPPRRFLLAATRRNVFFDSSLAPKLEANSQGITRRPSTKDLASALRCPSSPFVEFLSACLQWDPRDRMTPAEALQHPWILDKPQKTHSSHRSKAAATADRGTTSSYYRSSRSGRGNSSGTGTAGTLLPSLLPPIDTMSTSGGNVAIAGAGVTKKSKTNKLRGGAGGAHRRAADLVYA